MEIEKFIGNTPLVELDGIYLKCEQMNLTGSIKDRIAYEMLKRVDRKKYHTVLEVTSGNTGISVAAIASYFDLKATIICPTSTSEMKQDLMWKYGATVINVDGNIQDCMKLAIEGCKNYRYLFLNQFTNQYNIKAQQQMAFEIEQILTHNYCISYLGSEYFNSEVYQSLLPSIIVTGIGTGGTLAGLYDVFPKAKFFTWRCNEMIEGTSDGVPLPLKPRECNLIELDLEYDAIKACQKYLATKGLFVGLSSAANFHAATIEKTLYPKSKIVTILVDNGLRYM